MEEGKVVITSKSFGEMQSIPKKHTGRGEDSSPEFLIQNVSPEAKSFALTLDDTTHPLFGCYNHWLIWNVPVMEVIPENIAPGVKVKELENAVQGRAYGKHRYRGPKPPWGSHIYEYTVYVLDSMLDLGERSGIRDLLGAMEGHILQVGRLKGKYK